jgi:hypothetical protein
MDERIYIEERVSTESFQLSSKIIREEIDQKYYRLGLTDRTKRDL